MAISSAAPAKVERQPRDMGLAEYAPDPMIAVDTHGNMTWFNAAAETVFGHARTEAPYMSLADVLTPETWARVLMIMARQTPTHPACFEVDVLTSDGRLLPYELHCSVMQERGASPLILCVARDIGERKSAQRELHQANAELRAVLACMHRLQPMIKVCAWCRKIRTRAGEWVELQDFLAHGEVTHGMCGGCAASNPLG